MELIFPTAELELAALEYRASHFEFGEKEIHGDAGFDIAESYTAWLNKLKDNLNIKEGDFVPSTTYFGVKNGKIVGIIDIRHRLNDSLKKVGGHIGYSIKPSERGKGYATQMLSLALDKCREIGVSKALLTCNKSNIASAKVIMNNAGVLEDEFTDEEGNVVQRYWITLIKD